MAHRQVIATGLWSAPSTWQGGDVPVPGDTVGWLLAGGPSVVTVDQDVDVVSVNQGTEAGSIRFIDSRTFTCPSIVDSGNGDTIIVDGAGAVVNIIGNISGSVNGTSGSVLNILRAASVTHTGTITLGNGSSTTAIAIATPCAFTTTGNLLSGNGNAVVTLAAAADQSVITIGGNFTSGTTSSSRALVSNAPYFTLNVGGNLTCGTTTASVSVTGVGATVNVTGNVTAGNNSTAIGVTAASTITVGGNVTGGALTSTIFGISLGASASAVTVGGTVYMNGISGTGPFIADLRGVTAGGIGPAVRSTSASAILRIAGPFTANVIEGFVPVVAESWMVPANSNVEYYFRDDFDIAGPPTSRPVYLASWHPNSPPPTDVRLGTVYGPTGDLTGSMAVPPADTVAAGVSVDAGVGTSALTSNSVWDHPTAAATTVGSMGLRLREAATVASTGAQVAAALDEGP